jgi:hypothetical protein
MYILIYWGNRRIRTGIRNMLLHDERIANDKTDDPGCIATRFLAHNRAVIQLHKQHQSCFARVFLDCAFQLGKNASWPKAKVLQSPETAGATEAHRSC